MKLQFSENIKTIIKIQRFNWMAVSARILFGVSFAPKNSKENHLSNNEGPAMPEPSDLRIFQYSNFYISLLIYILEEFFFSGPRWIEVEKTGRRRREARKASCSANVVDVVRFRFVFRVRSLEMWKGGRQQAIYFELIVF
jgi:hypothetical protein